MSERGGAVNIVPPLQQMAEGAKGDEQQQKAAQRWGLPEISNDDRHTRKAR